MYVAVLIGLAGFLIFSILAAITFGNADLSLKDVYSVIAYKLFHIKSLSAYAEGAVHDVVWLIRLPRVLLALAVGMALSVCGVVMQAIVQNPLADPYVLGISSAALLRKEWKRYGLQTPPSVRFSALHPRSGNLLHCPVPESFYEAHAP